MATQMKWIALLRRKLRSRSSRGRILLWATLAGLIFGALNLGDSLDEYLRSQRTLLHRHAASGQIVLVEIDNRSNSAIGRWPWPRRYHGLLSEQLDRLGARRIFFDIVFTDKSDPANDQAFAKGVLPLGKRVIFPISHSYDVQSRNWVDTYPVDEFGKHAEIGTIALESSTSGMVRRAPFGLMAGDRLIPSFAALLADVPHVSENDFPIDYSIDVGSIVRVSASDVIAGKVPRKIFDGKDVIIGPTYTPWAEASIAPGYGMLPGVSLHILAAETLKKGVPYEPSWLWPFAAALALVIACILVNMRWFSSIAISTGLVGALALPLTFEKRLIFPDVVPAAFLLTIVGCALTWSALRQMYRVRGMTNAVSGLPNLTALQQEDAEGCALVAARVHNYAAIAAMLRPEDEKSLAQQISKRLSVGAADAKLFQGDEGIFAWFAEPGPRAATETHLDALHSLSRNPVIVRDRPFDIVITFGLDVEPSRSTANRLASALVAADEAQKQGLKWKEHDNSKLADNAWKLSLLSQLDAAIDAGDLWVAYQPKLDLRTDRIIGAEALARWTHPEKGPISPIEFILAAEQSNRIEKLTRHVIESAIRVAAVINRHGVDFNMSVNLSARLIEDSDLVEQVRTLLDRHDLPARCLTLEVTETAALSSSAGNLETLQQLRDMGVFLSVDDYGTGMSTLDYLQRIPATEIKIDRSFVAGMRANHATKVMVNSTIQLAHSLGQKVVAEGVEDAETLEELRQMNCDLAQGYLIGRPMTFRALSKKILGDSEEQAA